MSSWVDTGPDGTLGQLIRPLDRAGVYVPGGTAPLPSSLLMAAIPARVAGVGEVVVCTPAGSAGVNDLILAAAHVAKVDRLFALGGAQAIAALAYGTESVPRVDKIVGAGGLFITLAKRQVFGGVGIDGFYGPTETLVIADDSADPAWAAADLLAQAEHDVLASPILLTPSRALAEQVAAQLRRQLEGLSRAEIAAASLADRGGIVVTADLAEAVELANLYAPEHLCLLVAEPWALVGQIRNAGGIFVGEHSFEVLGDYVAGPSHVMPTEGSARYASPLSVADFVKRISLIAFTREAGARLSAPAAVSGPRRGVDGACGGGGDETSRQVGSRQGNKGLAVLCLLVSLSTCFPVTLSKEPLIDRLTLRHAPPPTHRGHGALHADRAVRGAERAAGPQPGADRQARRQREPVRPAPGRA